MDRHRLAVLAKEYEGRGVLLHELLRVDRAELNGWLAGARIPRSKVNRLEWWDSQLRVQRALEASGLPECAESKRLDERATSAILGKASSKEQDQAAQAALDHASSCELCQKREAVRASAGPLKGEPLPGYNRLTESPEDRASGLWALPIIACLGFAAMYADRGFDPDPRLPWIIACMGLLMPWLLWEGVPGRRKNQVAAGLCAVSGVIGLVLTDFDLLLANGWAPLIMPSLIIGIGLWVRWRR